MANPGGDGGSDMPNGEPIRPRRANVLLIEDPVMPRESPTKRRVFCELEWICELLDKHRTRGGEVFAVSVNEMIGDLREAAAREISGGAIGFEG